MKLNDILKESYHFVSVAGGDVDDIEISSIEYDSRKVSNGSLFVAVRGFETDGHNYVDAAISNGCRVILVSEDRVADFINREDLGVVFLVSHDTRRALSILSSIFYGHPSQKLYIVGVTGTNGKTSITYLVENIFNKNGHACGVIGTVNYRWKGTCIPAPNTTPESKDIQELLYKMLCDGVTHVVMEVSSHALYLNRVDDVFFDCAIFTNLTQDHLDFHKTFESYFAAKKRLFELLGNSIKKERFALINIDDDYGKKIYHECNKYNFRTLSFGETKDADIYANPDSIDNRITGLRYKLYYNSKKYDVALNISGRFQVYNSLAAFGAGCSFGIDPVNVISAMRDLKSVPGRLQVVDAGLDFYAVVDYAHTGDALLKLLQSIKEMPHKRIITVFGCGGDRDKTKRPIMGNIAVENSDFAIVSSDNPRTEDPMKIIEDIKAGITLSNYIVEPDREMAIAKAIDMAKSGDIIVIAGKGHEDYQIIGKEKFHFDDREIALKYMQGKKK